MAPLNNIKLLSLTFSLLLIVSSTTAQYDDPVADDDSPSPKPKALAPSPLSSQQVEADASPGPRAQERFVPVPSPSSSPQVEEADASPGPRAQERFAPVPSPSSSPQVEEADASPGPPAQERFAPVPSPSSSQQVEEADASPGQRAQERFAPVPSPSSSPSSFVSPPSPAEKESGGRSPSPSPSGAESTLPDSSPPSSTSKPPSEPPSGSDAPYYSGEYPPFDVDLTTMDGPVDVGPKTKEICDATDYPLLCQSTVAPLLKGDADVQSVLKAAINATNKLAGAGLSFARRVAERKGNPPELASILKDCRDSYDSAVYNFENAKSAFPERDTETMNSMLSAVITNVGDCEDVFAKSGMDCPFSSLADKLTNMTSNCLAIVSQMG